MLSNVLPNLTWERFDLDKGAVCDVWTAGTDLDHKSQRLLSHEDGSYEWTQAGDYRVAEVRLLHNVTTVGEVAAEKARAKDNLLIRGDALHALTSLSSIPEFRDEYVGKIKLAYIDPPFNTGQAFEHYDDALEHSVWLTMMRDRLVQIRDLLADDATLVVHLDVTEVAYCKVLLDELFGRANFVAEIIAELNPKGRQLSRFFATSHDYLLVYAKDIAKCSLRAATTENVDVSDFPLVDERGARHRLLPLRNTNKKFNPKTRPNLHYALYGDPVTGAVTVESRVGSVPITPLLETARMPFGDGVARWQSNGLQSCGRKR